MCILFTWLSFAPSCFTLLADVSVLPSIPTVAIVYGFFRGKMGLHLFFFLVCLKRLVVICWLVPPSYPDVAPRRSPVTGLLTFAARHGEHVPRTPFLSAFRHLLVFWRPCCAEVGVRRGTFRQVSPCAELF